MRINKSVCKQPFLLMLAIAGLILTACGDKAEITDMNIVVGFGIDQVGKNVRVVAQVRNIMVGDKSAGETGQGGGGNQYVNHSASGSTVEEAVQHLRKVTPRRLFFAHNTVVVFGSEYARNGIDPALDFLLRSREFRRTQLICVTSGTALALLTSSVGKEQVNAIGLERLLQPEDIEFYVPKTTEMIFLNDMLSPSQVPLMTWVDIERGKAIIKGVGLFRGDRLVDLFPDRLAQTLLLLRGEAPIYTVELPCQHPGQKTIVRIRFIRRELHPVHKDGDVSIHIRLHGTGEPVTLCSGDFLDPVMINRMTEKVNREMKEQLQNTVALLKQLKLDGVMMGSELYRVAPQWWRAHAREWPQLFAKVPVKIDTFVDVTRPGMYNTTPETHYTPELYPPRSKPGGEQD